MKKDKMKALAEETLKIIRVGYYKRYDILQDVASSYAQAKLFTEELLEELLVSTDNTKMQEMKISVTQNNVVDDLRKLRNEYPQEKIAVLNFGSARKAGGGFLTGSISQEESLCYTSTLYNAIKDFKGFYKNEDHLKNGLYSHRMIYAPEVVFIRDGQYQLLEPIKIDVLTSAAVNVRDLKEKGLTDELNQVTDVMTERIERIVALAKYQKVDVLVLGAFGCGVFENNPIEIASIFKKVLHDERFNGAFKEVVFSIYEKDGESILYKIFNNIK